MMAKVFLLLAAVTMSVASVACGALGQAGQGGLHLQVGQTDLTASQTQGSGIGQATGFGWAVAEQVRATVATQNALGASVGAPESVMERLMNRESVGAAVGVSDEIGQRLIDQGALGVAAATPESIRERLTNRETVAVIGIPNVVRERLMIAQTGE